MDQLVAGKLALLTPPLPSKASLMPRKRGPLLAELPFEYAVAGRPYSSESKTRGYNNWRARALSAVAETVDTKTRGYGYRPTNHQLRAVIVWLSAEPDASDYPDVDNVIKPLLDALEHQVIADDGQFHRIEISRIDLNRPALEPPESVMMALDEASAEDSGNIVWVWVDELVAPDGHERDWWRWVS